MKNSKLFTNAVVAGLALSLSITGFSGVSGNAEIVKSFNSPSKDNANSNITITATCRNLLQTTDIEAGLIELNAETLTDYIDYHEVDNASNDSDKKEKNTKQTKKTKKRKNLKSTKRNLKSYLELIKSQHIADVADVVVRLQELQPQELELKPEEL